MGQVGGCGVTALTLQLGEWYFKVRPSRAGMGSDKAFLAWCAKTPYLSDGPISVQLWGEEVYSTFGRTADEALSKLKREVLN